MTKQVKLTEVQARILSGTQAKKQELQAAISLLNEKEEMVAVLVAEGAGIDFASVTGAKFTGEDLEFTLKPGEAPKSDKKVKKLKAVEKVDAD